MNVVVNKLKHVNEKSIFGSGASTSLAIQPPLAPVIESPSSIQLTAFDNIIQKNDENDIYGKIRNRIQS